MNPRGQRPDAQPVAGEDELVTSTASIAGGIGTENAGKRDHQPSDSKHGLGGLPPGASAEL